MAGELQLGGTTLATHTGSGASAKINLDSGLVFPAGHVIQVVQNPINAGSTTTSLDFEDITNFSVDITPSSSSNKIFIIATGYVGNVLVSGFNAQVDHQLIRVNTPSDSILVGTTVFAVENSAGGLQIKASLAISYLESLSFWSSGSITYKIQHKVNNASSTGSLGTGRITVMEIQG